MALTCMALIMSPAWAAPPEIEDFCWAQAAQIRFNGRGEREAFIANCIADWTAGTPPPQGRKSYDRNRY